MKKLAFLFVIAGTAACGDAEAPREVPRTVSSDPFCQQVIPAVDAWLAERREARPQPDGDRYGGVVVAAATADLGG